jgi:hypothetical protein
MTTLLPSSSDVPPSDAFSPGGNPFPGPQAYVRGDREIFFGREQEIDELVSLVLSSSATLVYAPSGAGKSSLIEAGVGPRLEEEFSFTVLPTVRFGGQGSPALADKNVYVRAVVEAVAGPGHPGLDDIGTAAQVARPPLSKGALLVIDQFEEVFQDPAAWEQRQVLFAALTKALRDNPWLRTVIALRSDYLAELVPYARYLPGRLAIRYQLRSLSDEQAGSVISRAFTTSGLPLGTDELAVLLEVLLQDPARPIRAQYVNSIQLQIVCRRVWQERAIGGKSGGKVPPLDAHLTIRESMEQFVDDAISRVMHGTRGDEALIRWWLANELVTPGGRRAFVLLEDGATTAGLSNQVVQALVEAKLLQLEHRHGSVLVELTHDSMVEAVRSSHATWLREQERRRRRLALILLVLFFVLLSLFPVLKAPSHGPLIERTGTLEVEPVRLEFQAAGQGVAVEVSLYGAPVDVVVRTLESVGGGEKREVMRDVVQGGSDQPPSQGRRTSASPQTYAFKTVPEATYFVEVSTSEDVGPLPFGISVTEISVALAREGLESGVSSPRIGIPLEPRSRQMIQVDEGDLVGIGGVSLLAVDLVDDWAVVSTTDADALALLTLEDDVSTEPPTSAEVRWNSLPTTKTAVTDQFASLDSGSYAAVEYTVAEQSEPLGAEVNCAAPTVGLSLDREDSVPPGESTVPDLTIDPDTPYVLPLDVAAGRRELLLVARDRGLLDCTFRLRAFRDSQVTSVGNVLLTIPAGDGGTALSLTLPTDAVLVAEPDSRLSISMSCPPEGPDAGSTADGEHWLWYVPARERCTLWATRTEGLELRSDVDALETTLSIAAVTASDDRQS